MPTSKYDIIREDVLAELTYDPSTGYFTWTKSRQGRHPDRPAGYLDRHGYRVIHIRKRAYFAHRLAWFCVHGVWPTGRMDHRNRRTDDNRIRNLRPATAAQNSANRRMRTASASGYRGVRKCTKSENWQAAIKAEGKGIWIGVFATAIEAARAYDETAIRLHGEFAVLNFPTAARRRANAGEAVGGKLPRGPYRKKEQPVERSRPVEEEARKRILPGPEAFRPAEAA